MIARALRHGDSRIIVRATVDGVERHGRVRRQDERVRRALRARRIQVQGAGLERHVRRHRGNVNADKRPRRDRDAGSADGWVSREDTDDKVSLCGAARRGAERDDELRPRPRPWATSHIALSHHEGNGVGAGGP